jgi:hypothetical protein
MDVFNSIIIGFEWSQDLTLAVGMIDPGDTLRAEFRYAPEDVAPIFSISSPASGITISGNDVTLTVADEKTALVKAPRGSVGWRDVYMDLVKLTPNVGENHLGFRLKIPAILPVTRPAA